MYKIKRDMPHSSYFFFFIFLHLNDNTVNLWKFSDIQVIVV